MERKVYHSKNLTELSHQAAHLILMKALDCVKKDGLFTVALSGGQTPQILYACLAEQPYRDEIPWSNTHLFWADERCVPHSNPESNFQMAHTLFISKVPIPKDNVHSISVHLSQPQKIAEDYEYTLRSFFSGCDFPIFNLILLGVGKDGHTASLFPNHSVLEEKNRWVMAVEAPPSVSPRWRVTLTLPVLNNAETVLFLVSGVEKRSIVQSILTDSNTKSRFPAARVQTSGEVLWYGTCDVLDEDTV